VYLSLFHSEIITKYLTKTVSKWTSEPNRSWRRVCCCRCDVERCGTLVDVLDAPVCYSWWGLDYRVTYNTVLLLRVALSLNFQSSSTAQERQDTTGHVSLFPAAATSKTTAGAEKTFSRRPIRKKIFDFFFKWRILVHFIFLSDGGTPNVAEPGVTYLLYPPSRRTSPAV